MAKEKNIIKKEQARRYRAWTFLVYPETANTDWKSIVNSYHIRWALSPLHDQDINPDGTLKKPHFHIIMHFDNQKSYTQMLSITKSISASNPRSVDSLTGLIRYFVHMDNPEKAQYDIADIQSFCGFDVAKYLKATFTDLEQISKDIREFIREFQVKEISDLIEYADYSGRDDWNKVLLKSSYYFKNIIDSSRHRKFPKFATDEFGQTIITNAKRTKNDILQFIQAKSITDIESLKNYIYDNGETLWNAALGDDTFEMKVLKEILKQKGVKNRIVADRKEILEFIKENRISDSEQLKDFINEKNLESWQEVLDDDIEEIEQALAYRAELNYKIEFAIKDQRIDDCGKELFADIEEEDDLIDFTSSHKVKRNFNQFRPI